MRPGQAEWYSLPSISNTDNVLYPRPAVMPTPLLTYIDGVLFSPELPQYQPFTSKILINYNEKSKPRWVFCSDWCRCCIISLRLFRSNELCLQTSAQTSSHSASPLNTFDHKSTEFMITFLELFPHSSFIICRELNICSCKSITIN